MQYSVISLFLLASLAVGQESNFESETDDIISDLKSDVEQEGDEIELDEQDDTIELEDQDDSASSASSVSGGSAAFSSSVSKEEPREKLFGDYHLHIGAMRPTFSENYSDFYGPAPWVPTIGVDYLFFDWFATLGAGFRIGYFKDSGNAVTRSGSDVEKDEDGELELTLLPIQATGTLQMTLFDKKWLVLRGWFGAEYTYFQEMRVEDSESESSTSSSEDDSSNSEKPLVVSGWRLANVIGVGLSFLLNPLESRSVNSLRSIGISGVYLTPYFMLVNGLGGEKFNLSRTEIGAAFTFESI